MTTQTRVDAGYYLVRREGGPSIVVVIGSNGRGRAKIENFEIRRYVSNDRDHICRLTPGIQCGNDVSVAVIATAIEDLHYEIDPDSATVARIT